MKPPAIVIFLYLLGAFALIGGGICLIGGWLDGNSPLAAIGTSVLMGGAILLALGKLILLISALVNK